MFVQVYILLSLNMTGDFQTRSPNSADGHPIEGSPATIQATKENCPWVAAAANGDLNDRQYIVVEERACGLNYPEVDYGCQTATAFFMDPGKPLIKLNYFMLQERRTVHAGSCIAGGFD